jgi:hypothetical protein
MLADGVAHLDPASAVFQAMLEGASACDWMTCSAGVSSTAKDNRL